MEPCGFKCKLLNCFPFSSCYKYTSVCFICCFYLSSSPAEELRRTPCVSAFNYWRRSRFIIWIRALDNLSVQVFFFFCREMRCLDSPSSSTGLSGGAVDVRCSRWEERLTLLFPRHHHPTLVELHGARREALSPARRQLQEARSSPPPPLPQEHSRATGSERPAGLFSYRLLDTRWKRALLFSFFFFFFPPYIGGFALLLVLLLLLPPPPTPPPSDGIHGSITGSAWVIPFYSMSFRCDGHSVCVCVCVFVCLWVFVCWQRSASQPCFCELRFEMGQTTRIRTEKSSSSSSAVFI